MDLQATAIRAPVTINCLFALEDIERATTSEAKTKLSLYPTLSIKQGHSIRYGEILYTAADGRDFATDARQQPYVRSTLNGFLVDRDDASALNIPFDPTNPIQLKIAKRLTRRAIRVVGVAPKDTIFDGTAPGDPPVANIFGHQTIRNTGEAPIRAGQMIIADLPNPNRMQILQRGSGTNGQQTVNQNVPEHALHVKDKKVLATTPLHNVHVDFAPLTLLPAMFLLMPFLDGCLPEPYVKVLMKGMRGETLSVAEQKVLEDARFNDLQSNIASMSGKAMNNESRMKAWASISELLAVATTDKCMILQDEILEQMKDKRENHTKDACDALNMAVRSELNAHLSNFIGIATSDGEPGWNFDIMLTPPPTF